MAYTDLTQVRDCYARLRELVIHNAGGWEDVDSRSKVERLCSTAMQALEDSETRERLRTVQSQAGDLFSREGHLKWSRRNMSGADYLRLQILIALEAVNTRLFILDTLRTRTSQMPHPHAG